jgi:hypothetical protein
MGQIILNTLYVILAYLGALALVFFLFYKASKLMKKFKEAKKSASDQASGKIAAEQLFE